MVDPTRATPAERLNNGRDFVPTTSGWSSAITSPPSPDPGRSSARRSRRSSATCPGTLWIIVGAVLGGCVQDMTDSACSPPAATAAALGKWRAMSWARRRLRGIDRHLDDHDHPDRRARAGGRQCDEAQPVGDLDRVRHHPGRDTGRALHALWRPGRVLEATAVGVALILLSVFGGGWVDHQPWLRAVFDYPGISLAGFVIVYGFGSRRSCRYGCCSRRATTCPRSSSSARCFCSRSRSCSCIRRSRCRRSRHSSTAAGRSSAARCFRSSSSRLPAGRSPDFMRWYRAARHRSSSAARRRAPHRLRQHGARVLVAIMALIAATLLDPGVYFAIKVAAGVVGATPEAAVHTISGWGFPGQRRANARARRMTWARADSVRAYGRRALARGGHGEHLRLDLRPGAARALVSLCRSCSRRCSSWPRSMPARASGASCCRICSGMSGSRSGAPPGILP